MGSMLLVQLQSGPKPLAEWSSHEAWTEQGKGEHPRALLRTSENHPSVGLLATNSPQRQRRQKSRRLQTHQPPLNGMLHTRLEAANGPHLAQSTPSMASEKYNAAQRFLGRAECQAEPLLRPLSGLGEGRV